MTAPKVLLVGWDAADWRIMNPLLQQGKLPGLARLLSKGCHGNLATLDPMISPMLWTSIATGKRPYKHGIHGFTEVAADNNSARPIRVTQRTSKAVWNILNDHDLKTNVVGWWPSHPAEKVNGVSVSNFFAMTPPKDKPEWPVPEDSVYPQEWKDQLGELRLHPAELTPAIMANFFPEAGQLNSNDDGILRSAMRIVSHASSVHAAATEVMAKSHWDFMAVYYDSLDHFSHLGMKYHPPQLRGISDVDFKNYHYIVEGAYRFHDMMLDRLLDLAGENCNVLLVSDHGFESGAKRMLQLPDEPGAPALEHRPYGVFVASGPNFKTGQVYGTSLLDIAPTILNVFGLPTAKDMDGTVIKDALKKPIDRTVESYEGRTKAVDVYEPNHESIDADMLQQLVDLGYINQPETESEKRIALSENKYYLARSLADGGQFKTALHEMDLLCGSYPEIARYANFRQSLLLRLGKFKALKELLEKAEKTPHTIYLNALLFLQMNKPLLAAREFEKIAEIPDSELQLKAASAWFQAGEWQLATQHAEKALLLDEDNHGAMNLLAQISMAANAFEDALAYLFNSLKRIYHQPIVHEWIGQCLQHLEETESAAQAYEVSLRLNPGNHSVIERLKVLYMNDQSKLLRLKELESEHVEFGIVVTGFPRSGTSLMMQLLQAGGQAILMDENRKPDQFNEKGYLELQAVKNALTDQTFIRQLPGKAVKIVFPLLRFIKPVLPLKVIWMERETDAISRSQENMLGNPIDNLKFETIENMQKELRLHEAWLNQYDHVEYLKVNYKKLLHEPESELKRIAMFLKMDVEIDQLKTIINTDLRHF